MKKPCYTIQEESGDYHMVHSDGRITFPQGAAKAPRKAKAHARLSSARAIEASADGKAPHAVRLWRAGLNRTDKGDVYFTPRSGQLVMEAYNRRGNPLVFDYEHESLLPLEQRGGSPMKGIASAPAAVLAVRPSQEVPGGVECWGEGVEWTAEATRQILAGERRQISPVADFDTETREVTEIINVALCREGATHFGTILASVAKGTNMDDLVQAICDAAAAMDWEKVESLAQQAESMGPEGAMAAKMGRAMASAGGPPPPPPPPEKKPEAMTSALAATRLVADEALREARMGRVEGMIAANRDCFDPADERAHMRRADPSATTEHIASLRRKMEKGTIAATRIAEARENKDVKPGANDRHGLDDVEITVATQNGISLADFAKAKVRNAKPGAVS